MDSRQRRKLRRKLLRPVADGSPHYFVRNWEELSKVPDSPTHRLAISVRSKNGWVHRKDGEDELGHYLSTHTFYGSNYLQSTLLLRKFGFNVTLANWDANTTDTN